MLPLQIPGVNTDEVDRADSLVRADLQQEVQTLSGMSWEGRFQAIGEILWNWSLKFLLALAIFIVGRWVIKRISKLLNVIFEKRNLDQSLRTFTRSMVEIVFYIVLLYLVIWRLGVDTSLFVAMFAAAGLAIGMALSGVFQNFAGGVMILLLKPFKVGDWIELQGQSGKVTDIKLFNTVLLTAENKTILLPNGGVSTSVVNNYNTARTRRVEWAVSLTNGTDFEGARKLLLDLMAAEPKIMADPAPEVVLAKLNVASLDIVAHSWVASDDYWAVLTSMNAVIYRTLPEKGFKFPSQSMVVTFPDPESGVAPVSGPFGGR